MSFCTNVPGYMTELEFIKNHGYIAMGRELQMGFWDIVFLPSQASFAPYFIKVAVVVNALGLPHILGSSTYPWVCHISLGLPHILGLWLVIS